MALLLTALLPLSVLAAASHPPAPLRSHGSLVVTIPSHDGLLMCADRREYNEVQGPVDGRRKIFTVGQKIAFAGTGFTRVLDRQTLKPLFEINAEVLAVLGQAPEAEFEQRWQPLKQRLTDRLNELIDQKTWTAPDPANDGSIGVIYFLYLDSGGQIQSMRFNLTINAQGRAGIAETRITNVLASVPTVDGQTDVVAQIFRGTDPALADVRADEQIKRVWLNKDPRTTSLNDAIAVAHKLIRITNERHRLIASTPTKVSPDCDCLLMSALTGWRWLDK